MITPTRRPRRSGLRTSANVFVDWMSATRHGTRTMSIVRIGFGAITTLFLLVNMPVRDRIWGPDASYTWDLFAQTSLEAGQPSLFLLSAGSLWSDALYLALLAVSILFTLGWGGRATTIAFYVLLWSLQVRNPLATNGGDNLLRILLVYMMFAQVTAHYSLDALRARRRSERGTPPRRKSMSGTVLHNAALIACVAQVCVLYFTSGMYKIQGEMWQNGTALYYILRTAEYNSWPEITAMIYQWPAVVVGATYAAVLVQVFLPFVLLNRTLKAFLLPAVMGMHIAIGVLMGLPFFSATMLIADLFLVGDRDLRALRVRLRVLRMAVRRRLSDRTIPAVRAPQPQPQPLHESHAGARP